MGKKIRKKIFNYAGRNYSKVRVPDKQSPQSRSYQMAKIRSKGTKFELKFISVLESEFPNRFSTNVRSIKGAPDIVFEKEKVVIFLDSDFWHGWQYPRWRHLLKDDFWRNKIEKNRVRDKKTTLYLKRNGWKVIRLWEHKIKDEQKALNKIRQATNI